MKKTRQVIALMMIGLVLWPMTSWAAFGFGDVVWDPTNYVQNLAAALNTAQTVQKQVQDLSLLADFTQYTQTIQKAAAFARSVSQLSTRLLGRYSRWIAMIPGQIEWIPCTMQLLQSWSRVYDRDTQQSVSDAGASQTLLGNVEGILDSVTEVMAIARGIAGTVSGLQNLHTLLAQLVALVGGAQAMRAPMDEMQTRKEMRGFVHTQALEVMKENRLAGLEGRALQTCTSIPGI